MMMAPARMKKACDNQLRDGFGTPECSRRAAFRQPCMQRHGLSEALADSYVTVAGVLNCRSFR